MWTVGRYLQIKNTETGEELVIDKYVSRYRRLGYAFLNSLRLDRRFVKHITLTQKTESYEPNFLNNFFNSMRRCYKDIVYIWTAEIQEKRLAVTGESVLHYHIMMGFPYDDFHFGAEDVQRIQQYWKFGNVDIKPVRKPSVSYLMKYIQKSLDAPVEVLYKVRRIGSSKLAGWLRQSWSALTQAMARFASWGVDSDSLAGFQWVRGNAYAICEDGSRIQVYQKPKSNWIRMCTLDYDALTIF